MQDHIIFDPCGVEQTLGSYIPICVKPLRGYQGWHDYNRVIPGQCCRTFRRHFSAFRWLKTAFCHKPLACLLPVSIFAVTFDGLSSSN